jgi:excinuclease ABC subunit C
MDIGRCLAPCDDRISKADYRVLAEQVCLFLEGKTDDITKQVYSDMRAAADRLDFEEADRLKRKWMSLKALRETQRVVDPSGGDRDVLAVARNGREVAMVRLDIRDGRMTGFSRAFAEDTDEKDGAYLSAMIREQYRSASVPAEILVASPLDDQDVLTQWLRKKRGRAVHIRFPQRGDKKALIDMARHNAEKALERRSLARGADMRSIRETLMTLADLCHLERAPERIEAFDISNWGKDIRSASMIVFRNGKPERASYRHFKIKAFEGIDDYRAMAEVIMRRVDRLEDVSFGDRPDLILVDGGKGHVSTVLPILERIGIPVAGMVKDRRHRTRGLVIPTGEIVELSNPESIADARARPEEERAMRQGLLHLLTSIQDEAHRFAQRLNKKERRQRVMRYALENIKGVGPARRRLLLEAFGTSKKVEEASLEQLKEVKGLPEDVAESVFRYFHPDANVDDAGYAGQICVQPNSSRCERG